MKTITPKDERRFWEKSEVLGQEECWNWTGSVRNKGYGGFRHLGVLVSAHRFAWEIKNGEIPLGLFVLHRCDNPKCVNPSHLFLGDNSTNMRDREQKGRARHPVGELNGLSKMTESSVRKIREIYLSGGSSQKTIARLFGMSQSQISVIVRRETWSHV